MMRPVFCIRALLSIFFAVTISIPVQSSTIQNQQVFINNILPRYADDNYTIMDAHDGSTTQFEGPGSHFYYYAMGYGLCTENGQQADGSCGQLSNNTVGVWSSYNLQSGTWKLEHQFTPSEGSYGWPNCTYYRSHVVRRRVHDSVSKLPDTSNSSKVQSEYILYLNAQAGQDNECTACPISSARKCILMGLSSSPTGPFEYKGMLPLRYTMQGGVGDFDVFVDEDAAFNPKKQNNSPPAAYVLYKRSGAAPLPFSHRMTLQQLDDSYLGVLDNASAGMFGVPFVEAPALFRRGEFLYALFGKCCAFCEQGTGIGVYSATNALGPWTYHKNIGCSGEVKPECGCGLPTPQSLLPNGTTCPSSTEKRPHSVTFAQQNSIIRVRSNSGAQQSSNDTFVWTGDRWQSACRSTCEKQGVPAGSVDLRCVKGWDYQFWSVLKWDDTSTPPTPYQVKWEDNFTLLVS